MKFAEINFDPDDIALNDFLTNDIQFADRVLLKPTARTYICTGYAVLNVSSQHTKFKQLRHFIPRDEKLEQGFYAVWNQTLRYCRYCHEEGHVVVNCPKRRARASCWNCGIDGYIAASCTCDKPSKRAQKQPETSVTIQSSVEQAPTSLAITESSETTDAPTIDVDAENQVHYDETLPHNSPIVPSTPLITSTSPITVSPGKTGPKCCRIHAAQKLYERPVTRSQSVPPKEPIYVSSVSMQVGQTDTMITDSSMDSSSSVTQADEGHTNSCYNNMNNMLSIINTQLQARYSLWTRHCDIVSFSPSFIFSDNLAPENDGIILIKVKRPYNVLAPFWLLVLHSPATSGQQRQQFFDHILDLLHNQDLDIILDRLFITGDFNYSYLQPHLSSQTSLQ
ncbi:hypothetical protein G6F37_006318 [Rhizopus arrhizus]|nr:hypothetical protein G6F37_006318 [Rhizopus arrhizus]